MSKATDIWMPFYIGDYTSATMHLTTEQHGAYLLLLMTAWKMDGRIPDDDDQLAAICRLSPDKWKKTRQVLSGFFKIASGFWIQPRISREIEKANERKRVSAENGAFGGRPKTRQVSQTKPGANPEHNLHESTSPSPSPSDKTTLSPLPPTPLAEFLRLYPRTAQRPGGRERVVKIGERGKAELAKAMLTRPEYPWVRAARFERGKVAAGTARDLLTFLADLPAEEELPPEPVVRLHVPEQEPEPLTPEQEAEAEALLNAGLRKLGITEWQGKKIA
jgi:uncharacterized protein YdaU (DUF1376 family)